MASQSFDYSPQNVAGVVAAVSETRFATYRRHSAPSDASALRLYAWNVAASAAFYAPLQTLEVTLRNSIHDAMSANHGEGWFNHAKLLRPSERSLVDGALRRRGRRCEPATPGRVIAELPFGFWVALFANAYDTSIWRSDLHRIFTPRIKDRGALHETLDRLRTLRNRIAHHEPIFQRALSEDYQRIRAIIGLLSPPTLAWLSTHSTAARTLGSDPAQATHF